MKITTTFVILVNLLLLVSYGFSQSITLTNKIESGVYKKGEQIEIKAQISENASDSIHIKVWKNNNHLLKEQSIPATSNEFSAFSGTFDESVAIIVEVNVNEVKSELGAIVAPEDLKPGFKRPNDFDRYWKKQKKTLAQLPFEIKKENVQLSSDLQNFECFDVELNCLGPKPARGYYGKPKNAEGKSLPIVLIVRAAGVKGSWCLSNINETMNYTKMNNGALCFDLNAHGMLNGQEAEYYEKLEDGDLNTYWHIGENSMEDYYFRGMYLRLLRTIEFLTQQPEWDGKRILVVGESQGGGQALVAAGLDKRVNAVVATVPALCDLGGPLVNRKSGWPHPIEDHPNQLEMLKVLPYFDAANILKNAKATLVVEIGLIDQTCPATSVYSAINQAKGKKILYPVPYRTHKWPEKPYREIWDETVSSYKNTFINDFLK